MQNSAEFCFHYLRYISPVGCSQEIHRDKSQEVWDVLTEKGSIRFVLLEYGRIKGYVIETQDPKRGDMVNRKLSTLQVKGVVI